MDVTDSLPVPPPPRGRVLDVATLTAQVILAVLFAFAGIDKLFGLQPEVIGAFDRIGLGPWFRYLTGFLEFVGAVGLLVPDRAAVAAIGLAAVMAGATVVHLFILPPATMAAIPAALAALFAVIARMRWGERAR